MNLDWSVIDDSKLQRLINDLICLEVNRLLFMQSNPEIGKDKGLDGWYEGVYKKLGINSNTKFSIQSKWVGDRTPKYTFTKLKGYLEGDDGEIEKAIKARAEYLIIATNGKLNIEDHKKELAKQADGKSLKGLIVWDSEDLRSMIDAHPYLRLVYFQNPQYPSIVPPVVYFNQIEGHLLNLNDLVSYKDFANELKAVESFINSDKQILIAHAPGGYGKSHFLNLLSQEILVDDWALWCCRLSHRPLDRVIDEETNSEQKYVLLIDDVDRSLTEILPILRSISSGQQNIKIIITARIAGVPTVRESLIANRLSGKSEEIDISKWEEIELKNLFQGVSGEKNTSKIESIVKHYITPYVLVEIAKNIKRGGKGSQDWILRMYDDLKLEIHTALSRFTSDKDLLDSFTANLALIIPCSTADSETLNKLANLCSIDMQTVKKWLDTLVESRVLRLISDNYRFNPDLKGDIFVSKYLENASSSDIQEKMLYWLAINPTKVFNNISAAFDHSKHKKVVSIIESFVDELISKTKSEGTSSPHYIFEISRLLTHIVPEKAYQLFDVALKLLPNLRTDDTGPVLLAINNSSIEFERTLELLIGIMQTNTQGTYDNYKFQRLAKNLISPSHNSINKIRKSLETLDIWMSKSLNEDQLNILEWQLSCIMAISFEYEETWGYTITFGSWALNNSKSILDYRNKAVVIIENIYRIDPMRGIRVMDSVGNTSMVAGGVTNLPLESTAKKEQKKLISFVKNNLPTNLDVNDQIKFETFVLHWWAQEKGGDDIAESILAEMDRSAEYLILRSMIEYEALIADFEEFKKRDLSESTQERKEKSGRNNDSRWSWYVWTKLDNDENRNEILADLIPKLKEKHKESNEVINYLKELSESVKSSGAHSSNNKFLQLWVEDSSKLFKQIFDDNLKDIPDLFRPTIVFSLLNVINDPLDIVVVIINNPHEYVNGEIEAAIAKLSAIYDSSEFRRSLDSLIRKVGRDRLSPLMWSIARTNEKLSPQDLELVINAVISRTPIMTNTELDNLQMLIHRRDETKVVLTKNSIKKLKAILQYIPKSSYHFDQLISYLALDYKQVIEFIKGRLEIQHELDYLKYPSKLKKLNSIPRFIKTIYVSLKYRKFRNFYPNYISDFEAIDVFPNLASYINSYDEYCYFFDEVLQCDVSGRFFSRDVDRIADQVILKKEFYSNYTVELFKAKRIKELLHFLDFLPIQSSAEVLISNAEKILEEYPDEDKTVKSIFGSKTYPKGGRSSSPGEAPPQLVDLKNIFVESLKLTKNQQLKDIISECVSYIEGRIQSYTKDDEEFLNPI